MKTYVMGDPHGADRAVEQVLGRAAFDPHRDQLIVLGDVCDGWPDTDKVIDRLLTLENLVLIEGNHDLWALDWMRSGYVDLMWFESGGAGTLDSYARRAGRRFPEDWEECRSLSQTVPDQHRLLLENAEPYRVERRPDGREILYVHAGWDPACGPAEQSEATLLWERSFFDAAIREGPPMTEFDEVYIGHTPTPWSKPIKRRGVWALDQGAGWSGCLTLFDVDDQTFVQSDPVPDLYPDAEGRGGS